MEFSHALILNKTSGLCQSYPRHSFIKGKTKRIVVYFSTMEEQKLIFDGKIDALAIMQKAKRFVHIFLVKHLPSHFVFHNYDHAEQTVAVAQDFSGKAMLPLEDELALLLAAWFHDVGYVEGRKDHEERSVDIFQDFQKVESLPKKLTDSVIELILSTKEDAQTESLQQKILHDANWAWLGRKRFFRRGSLLRLERERCEGKTYTLQDWNEYLLELQLKQTFYTAWAKEEFDTRKNKNIAKQRENLLDAEKKTTRKITGKDFGRGVDTLYRVTLRNHINMSTIADGKANMIISINTLVLSILITAAAAAMSAGSFTIDDNLSVFVPTLILMITALSAIIFAVFSAIPKVAGVDFTMSDVKENKVSLLFFGNFLRVSEPEFVNYLNDLKTDQESLYDDLSHDLYNLGRVLEKKYRLLNISYRVFVGGLVLSVLSFLLLCI